jgi:protein-S-isoprenylcysteine O-methyltransferase Ste14
LEIPVIDPPKDAANVRFFPPGIPLSIIAVGIGLNHFLPFNLANEVPELVRYILGGTVAGSALLGLGAWSVIIMRRSGQSENPWKPTNSIIERGPFRISRNPMYLQMVIVCFGVAVGLMNGWLFVLTPFCGWLLQRLAIIPEEKYLERKFGNSYLAYKKRVPRWL